MQPMSHSFHCDDYEKAIETFYENGWTDGTPIVLPARKLVEAMVAASGMDREDSPWEPLHVERGCAPGSDAVTVFACEAPHSANCQGTPGEMLYVLADTLAALGSNNIHSGGQALVVINPRQAEEFARAGWTK